MRIAPAGNSRRFPGNPDRPLAADGAARRPIAPAAGVGGKYNLPHAQTHEIVLPYGDLEALLRAACSGADPMC